MNYEDLTEEQFEDMAEQLCAAWDTLDLVRKEVEGHGLPDSVFKAIRYRQQGIAKTLGQDPDKEPQWPPVRKWKVGLTQRRVIEFTAEIEVEAADEYEAEQLARDRTEDWTHHHEIEWEEAGEADEPRELDDETWQCTAV